MTTLNDIRDLEVRLHSHVLEWDDRHLLDELLFLLDELQYLHSDLDKCDIPTTDSNHLELNLRQRVKYLIAARTPVQVIHEGPQVPLDYYGKPLRAEPQQLPLF